MLMVNQIEDGLLPDLASFAELKANVYSPCANPKKLVISVGIYRFVRMFRA